MVEKKYNFEDEQSIAGLLGTLPRVEAPGNFDAHVRSRIAKGRPASRVGWLIPSAAAVSLCAIFLAAVAFVYLRGAEPQIADVRQSDVAPIVASQSPNSEFAVAADPVPENIQPDLREAQAISTVPERTNVPIRGKVSPSPDRGGSYVDRAIRPSADPIVPTGIPTPGSTPEANVKPPNTTVKVSAREIFQLIGLDAEFRDVGWQVQKVTDNSTAAKSDIRLGDVVEAIDDTRVSRDTTFESGFGGKNVTVVRDGERLTIRLRN